MRLKLLERNRWICEAFFLIIYMTLLCLLIALTLHLTICFLQCQQIKQAWLILSFSIHLIHYSVLVRKSFVPTAKLARRTNYRKNHRALLCTFKNLLMILDTSSLSNWLLAESTLMEIWSRRNIVMQQTTLSDLSLHATINIPPFAKKKGIFLKNKIKAQMHIAIQFHGIHRKLFSSSLFLCNFFLINAAVFKILSLISKAVFYDVVCSAASYVACPPILSVVDGCTPFAVFASRIDYSSTLLFFQ